MDQITPNELSQRLAAPSAPLVLDVRQPQETQAEGFIAGALLIPLDQLSARVKEIDPAREVVAVCKRGMRSLNAAAFLRQSGRKAQSMTGGMDAWAASGLPVARR